MSASHVAVFCAAHAFISEENTQRMKKLAAAVVVDTQSNDIWVCVTQPERFGGVEALMLRLGLNKFEAVRSENFELVLVSRKDGRTGAQVATLLRLWLSEFQGVRA